MKRNKKTEKHKAFLKKSKELDANREAQRNLGYKPLEKPIHHGYDAYWTLRDDVARREDSDKFQKIIDIFGLSAWCKRKDFKEWSYSVKKMIDVRPGFRDINQLEFDKLDSWIQKFFHPYQKNNSWGGASYTMYAVNIPSHFLVKKIVKSYKTHYKVIDEILKQEEAELNDEIWSTFYVETQKYWGRRGSKKWWKKNLNRKDRAYNKVALRKNLGFTFALYDDINDDWGCWPYYWADELKEFKYQHRHYGRWWIS